MSLVRSFKPDRRRVYEARHARRAAEGWSCAEGVVGVLLSLRLRWCGAVVAGWRGNVAGAWRLGFAADVGCAGSLAKFLAAVAVGAGKSVGRVSSSGVNLAVGFSCRGCSVVVVELVWVFLRGRAP